MLYKGIRINLIWAQYDHHNLHLGNGAKTRVRRKRVVFPFWYLLLIQIEEGSRIPPSVRDSPIDRRVKQRNLEHMVWLIESRCRRPPIAVIVVSRCRRPPIAVIVVSRRRRPPVIVIVVTCCRRSSVNVIVVTRRRRRVPTIAVVTACPRCTTLIVVNSRRYLNIPLTAGASRDAWRWGGRSHDSGSGAYRAFAFRLARLQSGPDEKRDDDDSYDANNQETVANPRRWVYYPSRRVVEDARIYERDDGYLLMTWIDSFGELATCLCIEAVFVKREREVVYREN